MDFPPGLFALYFAKTNPKRSKTRRDVDETNTVFLVFEARISFFISLIMMQVKVKGTFNKEAIRSLIITGQL